MNCTNCGQPIDQNDTFCKHCSAKVQSQSQLASITPPPIPVYVPNQQSSKRMPKRGILLAGLLIIGVTVIILVVAWPFITRAFRATQHYDDSHYGISATLPCTDWEFNNESYGNESVDEQILSSAECKMFIIFSIYLDQSDRQGEGVSGFADMMAHNWLEPGYTITAVSFHGYDAFKVAGLVKADQHKYVSDNLQYTMHLLKLHGKLYIIKVGVEESEWNNGGEVRANEFLDSIEFR